MQIAGCSSIYLLFSVTLPVLHTNERPEFFNQDFRPSQSCLKYWRSKIRKKIFFTNPQSHCRGYFVNLCHPIAQWSIFARYFDRCKVQYQRCVWFLSDSLRKRSIRHWIYCQICTEDVRRCSLMRSEDKRRQLWRWDIPNRCEKWNYQYPRYGCPSNFVAWAYRQTLPTVWKEIGSWSWRWWRITRIWK